MQVSTVLSFDSWTDENIHNRMDVEMKLQWEKCVYCVFFFLTNATNYLYFLCFKHNFTEKFDHGTFMIITKVLDIIKRCLILMNWNLSSLSFLSCEFYYSIFLFSKEKCGCPKTLICMNLHCEEGVHFLGQSSHIFSPLIGFKFKLHAIVTMDPIIGAISSTAT